MRSSTIRLGGKLRRSLSSFGVVLLVLSATSPVIGIYGGGLDVFQSAGSGAVAAFLIGIGGAVVWVVVYAELGSAYPYAGGDYVGVGSILGPRASIASLAGWVAFYGPAIAFTAKMVAQYVGELLPAADQSAITFGSLAAALAVALVAVRTSAFVTGVFLTVEMLAVLALIGAGASHSARSLGSVLSHPQMLGTAGALVPVSVGAMALGAVNAAFNTTGGGEAINFGEELREPHRRIGTVIVISGLIQALAVSLPVTLFVLGTADPRKAIGSSAPFSEFISSIAGPAAARTLNAGVALAAFNSMIVQIMTAARLFFSLGRDQILQGRINGFLATVNTASGVPRNATLVVAAITAACCLLSSHALLAFQSGTNAYSFGLVSLAVLVGRSRRLTAKPGYWRSPLFPMAPILGLLVAGMYFVGDFLDEDSGRPSILINGAVIALGLLWYQFVLRQRPDGWAPQLD